MAIVVNTDEVYKQLKKQNGEAVARVIRDAVLLDVPTILHILQYAGRDPEEVRKLIPIIREIYKQTKQSEFHTDKDPLELLSDAGYDAFVVKTEEQKNSIKKYYRQGEEICTLRDPHRHERFYMIHAIKRGVDKIKPSANPQREDEYGTSVISIQIAKTGGFISIKNRYNHTIKDPDNTFNSNPDNIIPGLSESLKRFFHVDFNVTGARIPSGFIIVNDQLVRYNYEIDNKYFGPDYYVEGSTITKLNNDNQILFFQGFVLTIAKGNNTVESVVKDNLEFCNSLNEFLHDKKISISTAKDKTKTILVNGKRFMDVKDGKITFIDASNLNEVAFKRHGTALIGDIDFSGTKHLALSDCDLTNVTGIKFGSGENVVEFVKLGFALDFSKATGVSLLNCDCKKVPSIKFNPNADRISCFSCADLPSPELFDFSGVNILHLKRCPLSKDTAIKFNPYALIIELETTGAKLSGSHDFSHVITLDLGNADLTNVTDLKLNPNANTIRFNNAKLSGDLDFSNVKHLELHNCDLSNVKSIKFPRNSSEVRLVDTKLPAGILDFSGINDLVLYGCDLSKMSNIKFNPNAPKIHVEKSPCKLIGDFDFSNVSNLELYNCDLSGITNMQLAELRKYQTVKIVDCKLSGNLDFSQTNKLYLSDCDLTDVKDIKFYPLAAVITLDGSRGLKLSGEYDFHGVGHLNLGYTDLTKIKNIKINNSHFLHSYTAFTAHGFSQENDVDFGETDFIELHDSDLTKANVVKLNPSAKCIKITNTKLKGNLDFSNVQELEMHDCDLTNVTSIKLNSEAHVIRLENTPLKLTGNLDFSEVSTLELLDCDLSEATSIKFNPGASRIKLHNSKLMGPLDFGFLHSPDLTGADLNKVSRVKLSYTPLINGIKSESLLELDFSKTARVDASDLTGLKNVIVTAGWADTGSLSLVDQKIAGTWNFAGIDHLKIENCDLSKVKKMLFNPDMNRVEIVKSRISGDLDFSMVKEDLILHECDLTNVKSFKFNPNSTKHCVYLWESVFAGDLDFTYGPDFIALMRTDFTKVKSIKLTNKQYKNLKEQEVMMNGERILFKQLAKYGIEIIRPNIFKTAKQKIAGLKLRMAQHNMQNQQNSSSGQSY
ncbi:MAG: hypothetical protein J6Y49_01375 [Alphaproteobacteria bacterium]|nr:hypothetical protein [Alphaproteobacteria bacterium]